MLLARGLVRHRQHLRGGERLEYRLHVEVRVREARVLHDGVAPVEEPELEVEPERALRGSARARRRERAGEPPHARRRAEQAKDPEGDEAHGARVPERHRGEPPEIGPARRPHAERHLTAVCTDLDRRLKIGGDRRRHCPAHRL